MKFRNADYFQRYYEDTTHSMLRRDLYSECDATVRDLYKFLGSASGLDEQTRDNVFRVIERTVGMSLMRADYIREGRAQQFLAVMPAPFSIEE
jgi:hypothetical protein